MKRARLTAESKLSHPTTKRRRSDVNLDPSSIQIARELNEHIRWPGFTLGDLTEEAQNQEAAVPGLS